MATFDLGIILQVITSPNAAFAQIRDNEERYFTQSIALLVISSILGALAILPMVMIPINDDFFEMDGTENIDTGFPIAESAVVLSFASSLLGGFVSAALYYFIGKKLDGNTNWKKVFSVVFHIHAVVIPITIIVGIVLFFMWNSFSTIQPSILLDPNISNDDAFSEIGPFIGYVILLVTLGIGFVIWGLIVSIKAIKTVHGFGTGKAFGLILLVGLITSLASIPFGFG